MESVINSSPARRHKSDCQQIKPGCSCDRKVVKCAQYPPLRKKHHSMQSFAFFKTTKLPPSSIHERLKTCSSFPQQGQKHIVPFELEGRQQADWYGGIDLLKEVKEYDTPEAGAHLLISHLQKSDHQLTLSIHLIYILFAVSLCGVTKYCTCRQDGQKHGH